jgi:hypothetical protein
VVGTNLDLTCFSACPTPLSVANDDTPNTHCSLSSPSLRSRPAGPCASHIPHGHATRVRASLAVFDASICPIHLLLAFRVATHLPTQPPKLSVRDSTCANTSRSFLCVLLGTWHGTPSQHSIHLSAAFSEPALARNCVVCEHALTMHHHAPPTSTSDLLCSSETILPSGSAKSRTR